MSTKPLKALRGYQASNIPTEMFTRQNPQNLKSVTAKITGIPKIPRYFLVGHSDGDLAGKSLLFSRHAKTFVGKFGKITDPKFRRI